MRQSIIKVSKKSRQSVITNEKTAILEIESKPPILNDLEASDGTPDECYFSCESGQIMVICLLAQGLLHPMLAYSFYFVVPYYVLGETDWGVGALGLMFSAATVGELIGAQVVPIAAVFDSNTALFCGHISQISLCFVGYALLGGFIIPGMYFAAAGMVLIGFGYALSSVQAYSTTLADGDEELEVSIMAGLGQSYTLSMVTMTLIFPPIYENFGFDMYCSVLMLLAAILLASLLLMIGLLNQKLNEMDQRDNANPGFNAVALGDDNSALNVGSKSKQPEDLDMVQVPLTKLMSPSMYMLLVLKAAQAFSNQMYFMSSPVVFSEDFNISSVLSGYVVCGSTIAAMFVLIFSRRIVSVWSDWQYPWDMTIYCTLFGIGVALYPIFYSPWVGYVGHAICVLTQQCLISVEMTTRLFLCPAPAFSRITGLSGFVQAACFLIAAIITPPIMAIDLRLPFAILAVMFFACAAATVVVFVARKRYLASQFGSKKGYLASERAFYTAANKAAHRRGALINQDNITMIDGIEDQLQQLQKRLFTRQSTAFLMCPMAASGMETFVNNAAIEDEMEREMLLAEQKMDNKLDAVNERFDAATDDRQMSAILKPISLRSHHSPLKSRKSRMSILGKQRLSRRSQFASMMGRQSVTMQRQSNVRASIMAITHKRRNGKKVSIARNSMLRRCEPSMALCEIAEDIEAEAKRRAQRVNTNKSAMFFGF